MMMPGSSFSNPNDKFKKPVIGSGPTAPQPSMFPKSPTAPTSPAATNPVPNPGMANYTQNVAQGIMTAKPPAPTASTYQAPMAKTAVTAQPIATPQAQTVVDAPQAQSAAPQQTTPTPQAPVQNQASQPAGLKDVGSLTQMGTSATDFIANQANKLGQDPGAITEAGKIYADRVTKGLQGDDPLVKNAQNKEDTAASMRQYMATTGTQEAMGNTHYQPGSAQYNRAMAKAQAGVDNANQEGQSAVNDYTRKRTADNMAAAQGLETQQYNRNADNLKNAVGAEDTSRANAVGERTHTDAKATEAINGMPEGAPKNTVRNLIAGGMSPEEAVQTVIGKTGQVNEQYRGSTPGATKVQGVKDEASAWVTATTGLKPGDPDYDTKVSQRMKDTDSAVQGPIADTKSQNEVQRLTDAINGDTLQPTDFQAAVTKGLVDKYESSTLPIDAKAKELIGKTISLGGKQVKVVAQGRVGGGRNGTHHSYVVVQDPSGKVLYNYNGTLSENPPRNLGVPGVSKDTGKYAVYDPKTKKLAYQKNPA